MIFFSTFSLIVSISSTSALVLRDPSSNNTITRRAPRPPQFCGRFPLPCLNIEDVCNNACFHIKCINPLSRRKMVAGPDMEGMAKANRFAAGTDANPGGSICRNYPFTQIMVDDQTLSAALYYNADEWPMATAVQVPYAQRGPRDHPSLRCVPVKENSSSGSTFNKFERGQGQSLHLRDPACAGPLIAGDTYDVDFDLGGASRQKLGHCIDLNAGHMNQNCDDYHQVRLTSKPNVYGKISKLYDPFPIPASPGVKKQPGSDNHYAIQYRSRPEMMQCTVEYVRTAHNEVSARVKNWRSQNQLNVRTSNANSAYTTTLTGLPFDLVITANGGLGTQLSFVYGNQQNTNNIRSYFQWDLESVGAGKGADPTQNKYCATKKGTVQYNPQDKRYPLGLPGDPPPNPILGLGQQDTELITCLFPCFMVATL